MYLKLWRAGIRCPHTEISLSQAKLAIKAMTMSYPVMIKPRFGMGSIGILKAYNRDELKAFYETCGHEAVDRVTVEFTIGGNFYIMPKGTFSLEANMEYNRLVGRIS